jgi:hypothetical protein
MFRSKWDYHWKLWTWQRFQQLVGAALVAVPAGFLLFFLAKGDLPADFQHDITIEHFDHRTIDHINIASAIGSCHLSGNISTWPSDWLRALQITSMDANEQTVTPVFLPSDARAHDQELTAFERAALWQSSRINKERARFLHEAEERQNRARSNQLRMLCLSAAAAFLVAVKALATNKDEDAPFRSLMKGAMLPISILALLMPVLATAVSGVATFDGDPNVVVRHVRTLAQLEQLHGRIAEDVTSDPFLCPIMRATNALYSTTTATPKSERALTVNPAGLTECLMDRMARTVAWEQRHEHILNDATQSLAHAGDLPRTADRPKPGLPAAEPARRVSGDICQAVFSVSGDVASLADHPAKDALNAPQKSDPGPL